MYTWIGNLCDSLNTLQTTHCFMVAYQWKIIRNLWSWLKITTTLTIPLRSWTFQNISQEGRILAQYLELKQGELVKNGIQIARTVFGKNQLISRKVIIIVEIRTLINEDHGVTRLIGIRNGNTVTLAAIMTTVLLMAIDMEKNTREISGKFNELWKFFVVLKLFFGIFNFLPPVEFRRIRSTRILKTVYSF